MPNRICVSFSLAIAIGCCGCHSSSSEPAGESAAVTAPAAVPIPADSPFAKVAVGMDMKEVYDKIGQPTDTGGHMTGKQFIPFYFGGDTHRVVSHYKGQGRIIFSRDGAFSSTMRVIEIQYDPTETGYQ